ncbi:MAG: hypothetical protein ACOX8W_07675 [bacterium]
MQYQTYRQRRRPKGTFNSININHLHRQNPWVAAWWSAAFPGFGQILLGSTLKGFLHFIWEISICVMARLNLAILYSFTGRFELAAAVVDKRWLLLYCASYVFSIWDSYRTAVILNNYADLADREHSSLPPIEVSPYSISFLFTRPPWIPAFWSLAMPGFGQLCIGRYLTGTFLLFWWITVVYRSRLLEAIHYTALGAFQSAGAVTDPQWLLFLPSIIGFAAYDAYVHTTEYSRLFITEQTRFLRACYQSPEFLLPKFPGR